MFIQMKNGRKSYGKGESEVHALDGADISLEKGKVYVILGPSGSGKSTMLNMLGGLDSLDEGSITVDGREISGLKAADLTKYRKTDVGFVFQFYNLVQNLTAKENVELASEIVDNALDPVTVLKDVGLADRMILYNKT